jgi:hypothetical protein
MAHRLRMRGLCQIKPRAAPLLQGFHSPPPNPLRACLYRQSPSRLDATSRNRRAASRRPRLSPYRRSFGFRPAPGVVTRLTGLPSSTSATTPSAMDRTRLVPATSNMVSNPPLAAQCRLVPLSGLWLRRFTRVLSPPMPPLRASTRGYMRMARMTLRVATPVPKSMPSNFGLFLNHPLPCWAWLLWECSLPAVGGSLGYSKCKATIRSGKVSVTRAYSQRAGRVTCPFAGWLRAGWL